MDMGGLPEMIMVALCILWAVSAVVGFLVGCRARSPGRAFLCGAATAAVAAWVLASAVDRPGWSDLLPLGWPPGLVAGCAAAAFWARAKRRLEPWDDNGRSCLTPDVEATARSRFNPSAKQGNQGAIRPADEGVREHGES